MVECRYCGEQISTESDDATDPDYLDHIAEEHIHDLSDIDEKKLRREWDGSVKEAKSPDYRFSAAQLGAATTIIVLFLGFFFVGYIM